jgi:cysteinyl-tRNA synthetase
MLRLHDTAEGRVVDVEPREPGKFSMYVCGPTVYDVPHIGHGRFALVFDVLRRYLEWTGLEVTYVSNITDIEDKIIMRAVKEGRPFDDVTAEYERDWWDAMKRLEILLPDDEPHATAYVERMVDYIAALVDRDVAYETSDGVYFRVSSVPDYGLLARQSLESLRSGARVDVNEEKANPLDFALWKKAKPGEPTWDSPWGPGRPGWHIECTVMSLDILGDGFDLHGGGIDLAFPHHENERAQALGLDHRFARHWVHNGMVETGGVKMSKSLGNYDTSLPQMLDQFDPRAYRLLVLNAHYRSPMEVTGKTMSQTVEELERLDSFARRFPSTDAEPSAEILDRFRAFMDDDLNTPRARSVLFDAVRDGNKSEDPATIAAVFSMCKALGVSLQAGGHEIDEETAALMSARDKARAEKDFATADTLRDELVGRGWTVEDTPGGTRVHR